MSSSKEKPSVSVIIPVYNGMNTLPNCLDSIEKQDYPKPLEIIIVDDGSKDGSGKYVESHGYKVIYQENLGPGLARNAGASASSGELLVFTDADCILDPNFITELAKPIIENDIVGSQGIFYSHQRNIVARFIQHEISERYNKQSKVQYIDWVATYGACYKRKVFLNNEGFDDSYSSEDAEFSFRLAEKGYKMVLATKALCQHLHYESFFKFIKFKYKRAYWTIWLYKRYPHRMVRDKMTPFLRKFQMLLLAEAIFFLLLGTWWKTSLYLGILSLIMLFISTLPFSIKVAKKDFILGVISPFFLLTRAACYFFGFSKGLLDYWQGKHIVKKSPPK